jgi:hypothetical protein
MMKVIGESVFSDSIAKNERGLCPKASGKAMPAFRAFGAAEHAPRPSSFLPLRI